MGKEGEKVKNHWFGARSSFHQIESRPTGANFVWTTRYV